VQLYVDGDTIEDYTDVRAAIPIHENALFHGQQTHFVGLVHENSHFYGQEMTQSKVGLSGEAKLHQGCQMN